MPTPLRSLAAILLILSGVVSLATAAELTFDLEIERGRVADAMRLIRVKEGDLVRLRWRADRPYVLHLHGYDIERRVEPGRDNELSFVARATGRFPITLHSPKERSGSRLSEEAPLVDVEVYPR
jgi:hypothetical protein